MNIINLKRIRDLKKVVTTKGDAVLAINPSETEKKLLPTNSLSLYFDSIDYEEDLAPHELSKCFTHVDAKALRNYLEANSDKRNLYIYCEDDSSYWSLLVVLYGFKGIKPSECVYLTVRELPYTIPCVWIVYVCDALYSNCNLLTEEVENFVVTKKAFDRYGNMVTASW